MPLEPAYEGEDVPIRVVYEDESGNAVAPDGVSGGTGPTITVTASDGTTVVDAVVMTEVETGTYEHVWDTAADTVGASTYDVAVTAELSAETKISKTTIRVS